MTQYPEAYLCRELGMAVVNIALITDYDAGVLEGTEAVTAHDVLAVFEQNAERIRKVVLDMIGRFPADLDALGAPGRPARTRGATAMPPAPADIRIFETGLLTDRMTSMPTTPRPPRRPPEPTHGCVRCGAQIPIHESMCERCNPLGLKAPAAIAGARHGDRWASRSRSCCSRSSRGSRSAASGRSRRVGRRRRRRPGGPAGDDHGHQRRVERRRDDLPDRRPDAAAGSGPRRRSSRARSSSRARR